MSKRFIFTAFIISAAYFISAFYVVDRLANAFYEDELKEERERVRQQVSVAKSSLEAIIYQNIYLADSLSTVVNIEPTFAVNNWQSIAKKLVANSGYVKNVGMAPDNIIQYVFPLEGNEAAIGVDFRDLPEQLKTVEKARLMNDVFIAGPLELIQGGKALIARFPVFKDYPISVDYWGTVSVVLDYRSILEATGLPDIKGADIALRGVDGLGEEGAVFFGSPEFFKSPDIKLPINIPNGQWVLAMTYDLKLSGQLQNRFYAVWGIGAVIVLFFYITVVALYRAFKVAKRSSLQDELTGLPNRRFIMSYLQSLIQQRGKKRAFVLVNIDLNHFKQVNDTLGHDAGDELLKYVARKIQQNIRTSDIVARVGGDEFLMVLTRLQQAEQVDSVLASLKRRVESEAMIWENTEVVPSLSMGYVIASAQLNDVETLLSLADDAMYEDKKKYRS